MALKATTMMTRGERLRSLPSCSSNSNFPSDEEEDETAELLRELEKIKKERAEQKEKEVFPPAAFLSRSFRLTGM